MLLTSLLLRTRIESNPILASYNSQLKSNQLAHRKVAASQDRQL